MKSNKSDIINRSSERMKMKIWIFVFELLSIFNTVIMIAVTTEYKSLNSSSADLVSCAFFKKSNLYIGARVEGISDTCEGLDFDWLTAPKYETEYSYMIKQMTSVRYTEPVRLQTATSNEVHVYMIPGMLSVGSEVEIHVTPGIPLKSWYIRLLPTEENIDSLYEFHAIHYLNKIRLNNQDFGTGAVLVDHVLPSNETMKVNIFVRETFLETFVDGVSINDMTHRLPPENARYVSIFSHPNTQHNTVIYVNFIRYAAGI